MNFGVMSLLLLVLFVTFESLNMMSSLCILVVTTSMMAMISSMVALMKSLIVVMVVTLLESLVGLIMEVRPVWAKSTPVAPRGMRQSDLSLSVPILVVVLMGIVRSIVRWVIRLRVRSILLVVGHLVMRVVVEMRVWEVAWWLTDHTVTYDTFDDGWIPELLLDVCWLWFVIEH